MHEENIVDPRGVAGFRHDFRHGDWKLPSCQALSFLNLPPTTQMTKQPSPSTVLTPQLTPSVTGYVHTKIWDERPAKYAKHVLKNVCIILFVLSVFSQITNFAIAQSLKNFFQKLGWSNKGSISMKLTFDSLCQFMCIIAGYISDERLGKFKTLLSAATIDCFGLLLLVIAALPAVLSHVGASKAIFNIGLFLGVATSQVCLRTLVWRWSVLNCCPRNRKVSIPQCSIRYRVAE